MLQLLQADESTIQNALQSSSVSALLLWQGTFSNFDFLAYAPDLQELKILSCFYVEPNEYRKIGTLKKLTSLTIDYANFLTSLDFLSELQELEKLEITCCTQVTNIEPLTNLIKLTHLDLSSSGQVFIENFDPIQNLKKLTYLDLSNLILLRDLHFLEGLTHLRYLNVNFCPLLEDISALKNIQSLQALHVSECTLIEPELGFILQRKLTEFTPPTVVAERRGPPSNFIKV